jgi:GR25 family glycosyltransferase involved in LPS biosynthesis
MIYAGRYINMDRSLDRRQALEAQFAAYGCADRYVRFSGVDGQRLDRSRSPLTAGECGCFESHYRCIKESMGEDIHLHILEDDVVFGPRTIPYLDQAIGDGFSQSEMIFTDLFIPGELSTLQFLVNFYRLTGILEPTPDGAPSYPKFINFYDLKKASFTGASSYLIRSDARPRLLRLMEAELAAGPTTPVDIFYNRIVRDGRITATCVLPFLTTVNPTEVLATTIEGRGQNARSNVAFFLLRNYFFVDKDEALVADLRRQLTHDLPDPHYIDTLLDVFKFIFSENFVAF